MVDQASFRPTARHPEREVAAVLALFVTPSVVVAGGAVLGSEDRVGSWGSSPGPGIVPNVIPISEKG